MAKILASKSSRRDRPVRISSWKSYDRLVPLYSRIELFEIYQHVHHTVPAVCLQFLCNVAGIGYFFQEKFDAHSLITVRLKRTLHEFESTKWENNDSVNGMLEIDLISLTFRRVQTLEISLPEMRTPEFSRGGWHMY
jgi:hypothetical protein